VKALQYHGDGHVAVAHVDEIPPGDGEVQVDVAFTGICGTDLHVVHGAMDARVTFPAVVGHEMSGRVAALGRNVDGVAVGDHVTVIPFRACGGCPACSAGHGHVCHELVFLGIDADGAMQSRWNVPADRLVPLPADLPLDLAALVEPLAVAVHDVERAEVEVGDRVLVVGGGPVGALIAMVCRSLGADVRLSEPDANRRELIEQLGIATINPMATDVVAEVTRWTEGAGADVALEVSGTGPGLAAAVAALKVRGRLAQVGVHTAPREVDLFRFFWRELTLVGARLYDRRDFERAIALLADGSLDVAPLISRVDALGDAEAAFDALERGGVMKVLVDCQR
jgi:(R,R)-butanediol dehydrogenase / meso-butanediol dehydrogenase / diacetyl reductase